VKLEKLNRRRDRRLQDVVPRSHRRGKTVVRFTVAEDGNVVRLSKAEKSLIDTIAWKETFRNMRR